MSKNYLWLVMDGRAAYDVDAAAVMECWGEFAEQPSMKKLRKSWGDMGCALCRAEITGKTSTSSPVSTGPIEFVCEIP